MDRTAEQQAQDRSRMNTEQLPARIIVIGVEDARLSVGELIEKYRGVGSDRILDQVVPQAGIGDQLSLWDRA